MWTVEVLALAAPD